MTRWLRGAPTWARPRYFVVAPFLALAMTAAPAWGFFPGTNGGDKGGPGGGGTGGGRTGGPSGGSGTAPEIDPAGAGSALTLLGGAVLIVVDSRRRRQALGPDGA